jgi:exopolysaccharide biosynthesis polyprenyl glycosylphosphotransferase
MSIDSRIDNIHNCSRPTESCVGTAPNLTDRRWTPRAIASELIKIVQQLSATPSLQIKILLVSDVLLAAASVVLGYTLSPSYSFFDLTHQHVSVEVAMPAFSAVFSLCGLAAGAYDRRHLRMLWQPFLAVMAAVVMTWAIFLLANYVIYYRSVGRWIVFISTVSLIPTAFGVRALLSFCGSRNQKNILVVGTTATASLVQDEVQKSGGSLSKIAAVTPGHFCTILDQSSRTDPDFRALDERGGFDLIILDDACEREVLLRALEYLKEGKQVAGFFWYFESTFQKAPLEKMDLNWLMSADLYLLRPLGRAFKRASDVLLASLGLILCLPLWVLIGILVKMSGPGPVFYCQTRVGLDGKTFSLIKFRSMVDGAESQGKPVWACKNDSRVTQIGKILRKTRLDETPQFINVLKGDMSFVGPRPERPEFVSLLSSSIPYYDVRHLVKPGITGWAQIMYRYGSTEKDAAEKLCYDLYYIKNGNFILDLAIIIRTLGTVMRGAR